MTKIYIVGAGGFGRELLEWIKNINKVKPTTNRLAPKIFKLLKLNIARLIHFHETLTKKTKISKSVTAVPKATPIDGASGKT